MALTSPQHVSAAVAGRYREAVWFAAPGGQRFRSVVPPALAAAAGEGAAVRLHLGGDGRLQGWSVPGGRGVDQRGWDGPLAGFTTLRCTGGCSGTWHAPGGHAAAGAAASRCLACHGSLIRATPG